jgi:glycosyl transferase family 2
MSSLAIVIPTRNFELLKYNLDSSIDFLSKNDVTIYISDNSEDDKIKQLVKSYSLIYINIRYKRNKSEKTFDNNVYNALITPQEDYIWALGDSYIIREQEILFIIKLIQKGYDAIIFNSGKRLQNHKEIEIYTDNIKFFRDLCWHCTLISSTILKKNFIKKSLENNFKKYIGSNFFHLGILMDSAGHKNPINICVTQKKVFNYNTSKKKTFWAQNLLGTFCDNWIKLIMALSKEFDDEKIGVIKSHSNNTGLFSFKMLCYYRFLEGDLKFKEVWKRRKTIPLVTKTPYFLFLIVSLIPIKILKAVSKLKHIVYN